VLATSLSFGTVPPRWSLYNRYIRSLLKGARPEQLPDKVPASPGVLPSYLT
jgi:hypothetical protein